MKQGARGCNKDTGLEICGQIIWGVGNKMRILLVALLVVAGFFAAGCSDPEVTSFNEVNQVPGDVWEHVRPKLPLQLLSSGDHSYIVFQSERAVTADYEIKDNRVIIKLDESGSKQEVTETHIYKLRTDAKRDKIDVRVNGEQRPFDQVTGF